MDEYTLGSYRMGSVFGSYSTGFLTTLIRFVERLPESHREMAYGYPGSVASGGRILEAFLPVIPLPAHAFVLN